MAQSKSQLKRQAIQHGIYIEAYTVVDHAVEEGVALGYRRAHKHLNNPAEAVMVETIHREVMNALCEVLRFDEID